MSSHIVEVCRIQQVNPHPNAERLELAQVKGWQCVVPKGKYQAGSLVTYIPVDSVLPVELSDRIGITKYLSNGRVRCAKLRGEPSFGVIIDPENQEWPEGHDVKEHYGITKYVPPVKFQHGDAEPEHPAFSRYTEIENMRNFTDIFEAGERVIATEKVHGCVQSSCRVRMADGRYVRIKDVRVGDMVFGYSDGKVIPTRVTKTFRNGRASQWIKISGKRKNAGRGGAIFSLVMTPNHEVWVPDRGKYVPAGELSVGDRISLTRTDVDLSPVQKQVILGKVLGDASIRVCPGGYILNYTHCADDEEYLEYTHSCLGSIGADWKGNGVSGHGSKMIRRRTITSASVEKYLAGFYHDGEKKCVPSWIVEEASPIAIAFWYMDDGSLSHHPDQEDRAHFAVCGFTESDCQVLLDVLAKFGVKGVYYKSGNVPGGELNHSRIRINATDAEKLFLLIAPYIPSCMHRKLPERHRVYTGGLQRYQAEFRPMLVDQVIESVECIKEVRQRYDIETETHNFFANGILVHNSNSRIALIRDGDQIIKISGSRKQQRKPDGSRNSMFWFPWSVPGVKELFSVYGGTHSQVILFGEIYGKVQSLRYGVDGLAFSAFDMMVDGHYLNNDEFRKLMLDYGIPAVPVLYDGPFDLSIIKSLAEGKTTINGADHIREGVVVRPAIERQHPKIGRVVLKYVGDGYLFGNESDSDDV